MSIPMLKGLRRHHRFKTSVGWASITGVHFITGNEWVNVALIYTIQMMALCEKLKCTTAALCLSNHTIKVCAQSIESLL